MKELFTTIPETKISNEMNTTNIGVLGKSQQEKWDRIEYSQQHIEMKQSSALCNTHTDTPANGNNSQSTSAQVEWSRTNERNQEKKLEQNYTYYTRFGGDTAHIFT